MSEPESNRALFELLKKSGYVTETSFRIEAPARRLTWEADLAETVYSGPYRAFSPNGSAGSKLTYRLSGFSFRFSTEQGQSALAVAHVGFGDAQSSMDLDGTTLITADLNPFSNRHFDIQVTEDTDGLALVRVQPEIDLATKFFWLPLKADPNVHVPEFLENETYRVRLTGGGNPAVKPAPANLATGFPGGLRVVSGTLTLETNRPGVAPVQVPAGMCLVHNKAQTSDDHPLMASVVAASCP